MLVTPAVLIPRPETELLVKTAQEWLAANPGRRVGADIGTGSGCIPVALAMLVPDLHMIAADISADALDVARSNAQRYFLHERVHLVHSNLMENVPGPFSLITANLPYIPEARLPELAVSKWEPRVALGGGEDGLEFIRPFLQQASTRLAPGGLVLAEIDASLELKVPETAKSLWPKAKIEVQKDLAGLPRMLKVQT
jgi:release factor glutamine methyltransferase